MKLSIYKRLLIVLVGLWVGCGPAAQIQQPQTQQPQPQTETGSSVTSSSTNGENPPAPVESSTSFLPVAAGENVWFGMTNLRADGNRVADGTGRLPDVVPIDVPLAGTPTWIVATAIVSETIWAATLADGRVQAFAVADGVAREIAVEPSQLPVGAPPLLRVDNGAARIVVGTESASPTTHPVVLAKSGALVTVEADGTVAVQRDGQTTRLAVDALPDARVLVDERESLLLLSKPTDRYGHGVLGDRVEASGITLVRTDPMLEVVRTIEIAEPDVIEGLAPIWVDWNGDGVREIIVTLANAQVGAWVAVYDEMGTLLATGPSIGRGSRWRHQLAVAPFGAGGELMLVDVLTPHIGGTVEFYAWRGNVLEIVASQFGYTSHVIGSRNLDMGVAGDFDGDGRQELLLPNQSRVELGAIRRTADGAVVAWSLPTDGIVVTNVAAVATSDGALQVGIGRANNVLRIWGP